VRRWEAKKGGESGKKRGPKTKAEGKKGVAIYQKVG